uniref:ubiquitin-like-specific protease 1D n=1 Tax=Erigeron canadensis TaxID=72917 RepID=UPI001CB94789|nr:ubiquitin-like-specific protease 1D [Erigeron canadensis]XP_043618001.1 ubiquitin-like-specific protease 1D [Erigeron canadensis]
MRNKIDKLEPILLHLDSYSTHDTAQIFENIKRFMEEELNHGSIKGIVHRIDDTVRCEVPHQQNAYDCGLYALLFIENFIKQAPNRMETEYTTMFGKKWFQEKEVGDLRSRMKNILTEFLRNQNLKTYHRQGKKPAVKSDDAPSNTLENAGKESGDDAPIMTPQPEVKAAKRRLNRDRELLRLGKDPQEPIPDLSQRKLRERPKKTKM